MSAYELRIYQIVPGKMDLLRKMLRDAVIPLMREYAMEPVAFWTTPDDTVLYWVVNHDSLDTITANWDRFHADPRWSKALSARPRGEPYVSHVTTASLISIPSLPPQERYGG